MQAPFDTSPSNEDLAARAQAGCLSSYEELMRRFQVPLLHFLRRVGPDLDAEDVLQETFLRAYSQLGRYRCRWRFSTWLFTIARRMSINFHRRPRVPGASAAAANREALRQAVSPAAGPEQLAVAAEDRQRLWAAAARVLGEEEQTALWLHYVEQIPVEEIAQVLDRSSAAVKTMMFRRKKLRPLVATLEPEGRRARPASPVETSHG